MQWRQQLPLPSPLQNRPTPHSNIWRNSRQNQPILAITVMGRQGFLKSVRNYRFLHTARLFVLNTRQVYTAQLSYHNSSSPSSSSLVNALKHSYKSMGSVWSFLLLSTLSCSVKTFSCEVWYLRCSVVGSHSIAMYELLQANSCSLHLITQPWQNLMTKINGYLSV